MANELNLLCKWFHYGGENVTTFSIIVPPGLRLCWFVLFRDGDGYLEHKCLLLYQPFGDALVAGAAPHSKGSKGLTEALRRLK